VLTLYYHPLSTYSQRVRIVLLEKKISATLVEVDLFARAQFLPDYVAKNPYSRVPAIEEDGWVLYESTAILEYLESTRPSSPLLPAAPRERAGVAMHMKLCDLEFAGPARDILVPKRFLPEERWKPEKMQRAKERIGRHLSILESQVQGHCYLVGDRFTLADVCYAPFLRFLAMMEMTPGPATGAWAGRVLERSSVKETGPAK
jgi:glutathione S-transferase